MNPAFTALLGYDEKVLLSKPFLTFVHPDDLQPTTTESKKIEEVPIMSKVPKGESESVGTPLGDIFGFLKPKPAAVEKPAVKIIEPVVVKSEIVVVPKAVVPIIEEVKKPAAGGFFSFLNFSIYGML